MATGMTCSCRTSPTTPIQGAFRCMSSDGWQRPKVGAQYTDVTRPADDLGGVHTMGPPCKNWQKIYQCFLSMVGLSHLSFEVPILSVAVFMWRGLLKYFTHRTNHSHSSAELSKRQISDLYRTLIQVSLANALRLYSPVSAVVPLTLAVSCCKASRT